MRFVLLLLALAGCGAARAEGSTAHSVLAYNVLYEGADDERSLELIESQNADVVCLTELTHRFSKRFVEKLGKRYPHRAFEPKVGTWGVGIASRVPLQGSKVFPQRPHKIPGMEATVTLGGRPVTFACLHFIPPVAKHRKSDDFFTTMDKNAALRLEQAKGLIARYPESRGTVLLVGDLNETASGKGHNALIAAGFADACAIENEDCGATWPGATSYAPAVVQIDHALGRGVRFISASVITSGGSDHFPIRATFDFKTHKESQ